MSAAQLMTFGLVVGACIGALIAAAYGAGAPARRNRYLFLGFISGAAGGAIGLLLGQSVYQLIGGISEAGAENRMAGPLGYLGLIAARSLGWAGIGAGLGILQGAINGSWPRSRNGLVGGALGGFAGGLIFALLSLLVRVTTDSLTGASPFFFLTGEANRAIALTLMGSAIGLFVGLTERMLRRAWVRVRLGRNEGMEYLLEKPVNSVGRDELCDVPLFGDMQVERQHATISGSRGTYVIDALAEGVAVNGQPVQRAPLQDGDVISVAGREIEFHQKGSPRVVGAVDVARPVIAPPPLPEGLCPFCGQRKDAKGACACSPSAATGAAPVDAPVPAPGAPRLVALAGPHAGQSFPLEKAEVTVGRSPDQDIPLANDAAVSRRHARLIVASANVEVLDEGSSNGTFVNGARVQRRALHTGDEIRFGETRFRVEGA
jgi:pSer/pThr/pTyr-binding forkhead associated (FHA) protein